MPFCAVPDIRCYFFIELPIPGYRLSPHAGSRPSSAVARTKTLAGAEAKLAQFRIYPNPVRSGDPELIVSGYGEVDESIETNIEIINITDEVVFAERIVCGGNCSDYLIQLNKQLHPGAYCEP